MQIKEAVKTISSQCQYRWTVMCTSVTSKLLIKHQINWLLSRRVRDPRAPLDLRQPRHRCRSPEPGSPNHLVLSPTSEVRCSFSGACVLQEASRRQRRAETHRASTEYEHYHHTQAARATQGRVHDPSATAGKRATPHYYRSWPADHPHASSLHLF